jgi:hypothetical protein
MFFDSLFLSKVKKITAGPIDSVRTVYEQSRDGCERCDGCDGRFRLALGLNQSFIQWVAVVEAVEADHSPPTSAEVRKMWIYTSNPP